MLFLAPPLSLSLSLSVLLWLSRQLSLSPQLDGVLAIHEFHVWSLAGNKIVASLHLRLRSLDDYVRVSNEVKEYFHDEGIHSVTIQPEFVDVSYPIAPQAPTPPPTSCWWYLIRLRYSSTWRSQVASAYLSVVPRRTVIRPHAVRWRRRLIHSVLQARWLTPNQWKQQQTRLSSNRLWHKKRSRRSPRSEL